MYYVYTLSRPDGSVFYVGKGKGRRIYDHEVQARKGVQSHKCNIIRKIWASGGQVLCTKVYENLTEEEAFLYETQLIRFYGRSVLSNKTDGGEGCSGRTLSEETRLRIQRSLTGVAHPPERIATNSHSHKGMKPINLDQLVQLHRGKPLTTSHKEKIAKSHLGIKPSPETVEKQRSKIIGRKATQEQIEKQRLAQTGVPLTQYHRDRVAAAKRSDPHIFISPEGEYYTVYNLRTFCREHGLDSGNMSKLSSGSRTSYKGWLRGKAS